MGDTPFNIPPAKRREPKAFEPPPWEAEAFPEARPQEQEPNPQPVQQPVREPEPEKQAAPVPAAAEQAKVKEEQPKPAAQEAGDGAVKIEEALLVELFAKLAAEEEPAGKGLWRIAIVVAIFLAALGGVLVIWGMAAAVGSGRTGAMGAMGGAVLLLFGGGFIAGAVWLTVRTLRQRGVL